MDIRQLRYFLAVAHELSFTRAAERVHIGQSPLSQQIIALEEELGCALFDRDKRSVRLTLAGTVLVEHAQRVINAAAAATAAVRASQRGAIGSVSVGAIYTAINSFVPSALRIFRGLAPEAEVRLQEMTIAQQVEALADGRIEVGILRGDVRHPGLTTEVLYRERLVLAVPSGSIWDGPAPVQLDDLAGWPLVAVARGSRGGYADRIMDLFEVRDLTPTVCNEVLDMHTSVCLVAAGIGVAIVPAMTQLVRHPGVNYRSLAAVDVDVSCVLAWMRSSTSSKTVNLFLDAARLNAHRLCMQHPDLLLRRQKTAPSQASDPHSLH